MPKNLVYHPSFKVINTPQISSQNFNQDFGNGFYVYFVKEDAVRGARRYPKSILNVYNLLIDENLDILEFKYLNEEYLDFIHSCRLGKTHTHDVVIGPMVNSQTYNLIADLEDGIITREQFFSLVKFKYPTYQICFASERSLRCLKFEYSEEVI
ncbi:MAG: DUF3990 domain-containing protein [Succinivibrionaceae bacterium]|nr:DUF3990 domain-containing protein [Succinivibrionaceae bacterium]